MIFLEMIPIIKNIILIMVNYKKIIAFNLKWCKKKLNQIF